MEQTRAAVLRFAAGVMAADRAQIAAAATPDITWTVPYPASVPTTDAAMQATSVDGHVLQAQY